MELIIYWAKNVAINVSLKVIILKVRATNVKITVLMLIVFLKDNFVAKIVILINILI